MPTSQEFHLLPISQITVPEGRHRKSFKDIEELAMSIERNGLLHPIVVKRDGTLVVGERRLRACQLLGDETIPAQYFDELNPQEARCAELEENIKRQDLTWQEDCLAHLEFHAGQEELHDGIWSTEMSADYLGCGLRSLQQRLEVAREIDAGNDKLAGCDSFSAARTILARDRDRAVGGELQVLDDSILADIVTGNGPKVTGPTPTPGGGVEIPPPPWERNPHRPAEEDITCEDFRVFAQEYEGEPFNLLHIDFPYGIRQDESDQGSASSWETYEDGPEVYWSLLRCLLRHKDRLLAESTHLMFWLSMNYYAPTLEAFTQEGFVVNPRPLIWAKSDNVGIIPDALRGPRQVYEAALLISRGDRKIVTPVSDVCYKPGSRKDARHQSEKPWGVCSHFLRMLVDEHTTMLDPTCGCGNALAVGWRFGARAVRGLDFNDDCTESSRKILNQTRMLMAGESRAEAKKFLDETYPIPDSIDDLDLDV
jgi:ParB family chromosome partitioning protein